MKAHPCWIKLCCHRWAIGMTLFAKLCSSEIPCRGLNSIPRDFWQMVYWAEITKSKGNDQFIIVLLLKHICWLLLCSYVHASLGFPTSIKLTSEMKAKKERIYCFSLLNFGLGSLVYENMETIVNCVLLKLVCKIRNTFLHHKGFNAFSLLFLMI